MLQPWMPHCPWDQTGANSKENFLEMCVAWMILYRSAFMRSQNFKDYVAKTAPNQRCSRAVLLLLASSEPTTSMRTHNFLNSKLITEKSDLQTMIITGSFFYPRSSAAWSCATWELEEYSSFCWWCSTSTLAHFHLLPLCCFSILLLLNFFWWSWNQQKLFKF